MLALSLAAGIASCGRPADIDEPIRVLSPEYTAADESAGRPSLPISGIPEAEAPVVETARISFLAAGDNVIHPCIYIDARNRAAADPGAVRAYDFKPTYTDVIDFVASFDLAFINQETLMGGEALGYSGYPRFNSPQELGLDLVEMGFDIVGIANNHMCDKGASGLQGTIDFWKTQPVTLIGGYENEADYNTPRIIEREGVKIGLLSYTYGTNGLSLPQSSELIVPLIDDETIIAQCAAVNELCDFLIVSVHWGIENQTEPSAEQRRVASLLADQGVDVILGHHPHVLQPIEWVEGSDGGRTLCIYSLGNLISGMAAWQNMVGGFLTFDIVAMSDGTVYTDAPAFIPTAFHFGPRWYNSHLYFLDVYPEEMAAEHGTKKMYNSGVSPAKMMEYASRIMGDFIIPSPMAGAVASKCNSPQ